MLLKKNVPFIWTKETLTAFKELKDILCSKPLLRYPNISKQFGVTTDASNFAAAVILSEGTVEKYLPLTYASTSSHSEVLNYSTIEKELSAIMFASKQFRLYIYCSKFLLLTGHRTLVMLCNLKDPIVGGRLVRWRVKLSECH